LVHLAKKFKCRGRCGENGKGEGRSSKEGGPRHDGKKPGEEEKNPKGKTLNDEGDLSQKKAKNFARGWGGSR